jgi:hypothetical protein
VLLPAYEGELAAALGRYTALQFVGLPCVVREDTDRQSAPVTFIEQLSGAAQLRHLHLDRLLVGPVATWRGFGDQLARLTQPTRLNMSSDCEYATTGARGGQLLRSACGLVECMAPMTHLQHVRLPLWVKVAPGHARAQMVRSRDEVAAVVAQQWRGLTQLTTLDLQGELGAEAASLLSVRLAPLGAQLLYVGESPCAQHAAPLKALPGGGARLDLSCVGIDDRLVDAGKCAQLHAEFLAVRAPLLRDGHIVVLAREGAH